LQPASETIGAPNTFLERGAFMCIETEADHLSPVADADDVGTTDETLTFVARPTVDRLIAMRARCFDPRGSYNHLFHSDDPRDIARAKAICARCPVQDLCLTRALERTEPCGVWGGELLVDGEIASYPRRRGRRPKVLVPLDVDEVTGLACEPIANVG
jgi:WhiB family redox-sensing transcriptional regulator